MLAMLGLVLLLFHLGIEFSVDELSAAGGGCCGPAAPTSR